MSHARQSRSEVCPRKLDGREKAPRLVHQANPRCRRMARPVQFGNERVPHDRATSASRPHPPRSAPSAIAVLTAGMGCRYVQLCTDIFLSHNALHSAMFPNARWRFPGEHRDAPLTRSITMQIERLLVSKKELKTIGIPYSFQHIARLERDRLKIGGGRAKGVFFASVL